MRERMDPLHMPASTEDTQLVLAEAVAQHGAGSSAMMKTRDAG
jgi:hypothetical protein